MSFYPSSSLGSHVLDRPTCAGAILRLFLILAAAVATPASATFAPPTIVILTIQDELQVDADKARTIETAVRTFNPGARVVPVTIKQPAHAKVIEDYLESSDGADPDDVRNDFASGLDAVAAEVRRELDAALSEIHSVDQFILYSSIVSFDEAAEPERARFSLVGVGGMVEGSFLPKTALALAPIRRRLVENGSIILLGGATLFKKAASNERLAARILDFFGAPDGALFGLFRGEREDSPPKLRPDLSWAQTFAWAGVGATAASAGLYADVLNMTWALFLIGQTPVVVNSALILSDYARVRARQRLENRFGLDFKGYRITRRSGVEARGLDRDEREIFSCESNLIDLKAS